MQGWIIQVHQVLAGEMAAEREYLNQRQLKLGHAPKRWRRILRATERLGRATGSSHQSGKPTFRRFSAIRSSTAGENTIACLNFEMVRSG